MTIFNTPAEERAYHKGVEDGRKLEQLRKTDEFQRHYDFRYRIDPGAIIEGAPRMVQFSQTIRREVFDNLNLDVALAHFAKPLWAWVVKEKLMSAQVDLYPPTQQKVMVSDEVRIFASIPLFIPTQVTRSQPVDWTALSSPT